MRIAGTLSENNRRECSPPLNSFVITNRTGNCVAYIDNSGNLWLKEIVSVNAIS